MDNKEEKLPSTKPKFEDKLDIIDSLINKKRNRWNIQAIAYMDFDDVAQLIRLHIYNKWDQYDPSKPLEPWANTIITNQMKNLRRNIHDTYARPCLKCAENQGNDLCALFGKQCSDCPIYAYWEKHKKRAYDLKLPLPIENHQTEVYEIPHYSYDLEKAIEQLHKKMKEVLKPIEWKIYDCLYIKQLSEEETAKRMGYITRENNRRPGYNTFVRIKKIIYQKASKFKNEIDF